MNQRKRFMKFSRDTLWTRGRISFKFLKLQPHQLKIIFLLNRDFGEFIIQRPRKWSATFLRNQPRPQSIIESHQRIPALKKFSITRIISRVLPFLHIIRIFCHIQKGNFFVIRYLAAAFCFFKFFTSLKI